MNVISLGAPQDIFTTEPMQLQEEHNIDDNGKNQVHVLLMEHERKRGETITETLESPIIKMANIKKTIKGTRQAIKSLQHPTSGRAEINFEFLANRESLDIGAISQTITRIYKPRHRIWNWIVVS